jgi:hypothetical protein
MPQPSTARSQSHRNQFRIYGGESSTGSFLPALLLTLPIVFHQSTILIHPSCAGLRGPFVSTIPRLTASHNRKRIVMTYLKLKEGTYSLCLKRIILTVTAWVRALIYGIPLRRRHTGPIKSEVSFNESMTSQWMPFVRFRVHNKPKTNIMHSSHNLEHNIK